VPKADAVDAHQAEVDVDDVKSDLPTVDVTEIQDRHEPPDSDETIDEGSEVDDTVPEDTKDTVPEDTKDTVPEDTKDTVPEDTKDTVPEDTKDTVPEDTKDTVPEDTEEPDVCLPDCDGKQCGEDGCGDLCGTCEEWEQCVDGACQCTPDCEGKECGEDGCGESCGECDLWSSLYCVDGQCQCKLAPSVDLNKTQSEGDDDYCYAVALSSNGHYVMSGDSYGSTILREIQLWRVNAETGANKCYMYLPGNGTNRVRAMLPLDDGRMVLAGTYSKKKSGGFPTKWDFLFATTKTGPDYPCHIEQETIKNFGDANNEEAYDIDPLPGNSGYVLAGYQQTSDSSTERDIWVVTTDLQGNPSLPGIHFGGSGHQEARALEVADDGFVIAGFTDQGDGYQALVVKLDPAGNMVWENYLGAGRARALASLSDGSFAATGYLVKDETGKDLHLWVIDSSGQTVVNGVVEGEGDDDGFGLAVHPTGGFITVGETSTGASGALDGIVVRFTDSGELLWQANLGGTKADHFRSVLIEDSGRVVAAGYRDHESVAANKTDFWMVRLATECP
jgi:hypothetical protein